MTPYDILNEWMSIEESLGVMASQRAILATATVDGKPSSRVVAIREVSEQGVLFFTQKRTRKVAESVRKKNYLSCKRHTTIKTSQCVSTMSVLGCEQIESISIH